MSQERVVLFNSSRYQSFQFTLYHSIVCKKRCVCLKAAAPGKDQRGEFLRVEDSVFIPARGKTKPLPPEVLEIPQVKTALETPMFLKEASRLADIRVYKPKGKR